MNKLENKIKIRKLNYAWEQSYQPDLGTVVPVSLRKIWASVTCEQSCHSHLEKIVPASLGNNRASVTLEKMRRYHLGTTVPVSPRNYCVSLKCRLPVHDEIFIYICKETLLNIFVCVFLSCHIRVLT